MMRVSWATEPGSPDRPNEDFVAAAPGAVVVLDGCSLPLGTDLGCLHGTAWYARRLGTRLLTRMLDDPAVPVAGAGGDPLRAALAESIAEVAAAHAGTCNLSHPNTPAATVVALRVRGDAVEYLVLADSSLVLHTLGRLEVVTKPMARTYAAAHPAAARRAITGVVPLPGLRRAALLTDGATRLADSFGVNDWRELVHLLEEYGPAALIERTREAELTDPDGLRWPRTKRHDDATAAFCTF
jgi:hypothetical protein